ncbi:MAG: 8-oxo-dGTP diphosphatase MutT [Proteobacteria bacterium]|nr:8-oxo-dGTP diphosphatase MutT [Pseudomonadota bacterium]MDA1064026.1 8-oxo-dGTP diphosphatase MutT [Pseudomonadota bacterium]
MIRLHVAAGILRNEAGQVLITERLCDGPYNGLWEFPGGKIRTGESPDDALRRELNEELGVDAITVAPFMNLSHTYPDRSVELEFFLVDEWRGEPSGLDGQRIRWVPVAELDIAELLPADGPIVIALQER